MSGTGAGSTAESKSNLEKPAVQAKPKKKMAMEPTEKGLKVADGERHGEKPIFVNTSDGFGCSTAANRKFKLNHENQKVRQGSALNSDIPNFINKRRSELQNRSSTIANMKKLRATAGSVQAGETRRAMILQ